MLAFKAALYIVTFSTALFFGFWEMNLKRKLTDDFLAQQPENVSDFDSFYEIRRGIKRERILQGLPREALFKLRIIMGLKVLFALVFVGKVLVLQSR